MAFKSLDQAGYMHEHPEILGKAGLKEWDAATKGKHLPKHVKDSHMSKPKHHSPIKHSHVVHHSDGTKTVHHYHHPVSVPEVSAEMGDHSHAVADLKGMQDNFASQMGASNEGGMPAATGAVPAQGE